MTIYGVEAKGGAYSAIAALVNIPATILGATIYELFIVDSDRPVSSGGLEFINHHANHRRTLQQNNGDRRHSVQSMVDLADTSSQEKPTIATFEHAPGNNGSMQV
ncbi:hypothetical protein JR316_0006265 [Psilocybe cubensis]|uniref:Uncharacterized protein n=2 Tax=Psilocybe cubensis TaxID=181762 RepID=A0ACB8H1T6_PSICU|nr:hypothetical protein JR316_0006265 [Psilocybe cubensis]KAH9481738.1 hypothetical protein JR316_0006265 [Psilocybe cubensis]